MDCPKCNEILKNKGEVRIRGRAGIMSFSDHIVNMWVCPRCGYVEFYYAKGAQINNFQVFNFFPSITQLSV